MGASLLNLMRKSNWVTQDLDRRALSITIPGPRELLAHFGLQI
jgi:hypothetical protein